MSSMNRSPIRFPFDDQLVILPWQRLSRVLQYHQTAHRCNPFPNTIHPPFNSPLLKITHPRYIVFDKDVDFNTGRSSPSRAYRQFQSRQRLGKRRNFAFRRCFSPSGRRIPPGRTQLSAVLAGVFTSGGFCASGCMVAGRSTGKEVRKGRSGLSHRTAGAATPKYDPRVRTM